MAKKALNVEAIAEKLGEIIQGVLDIAGEVGIDAADLGIGVGEEAEADEEEAFDVEAALEGFELDDLKVIAEALEIDVKKLKTEAKIKAAIIAKGDEVEAVLAELSADEEEGEEGEEGEEVDMDEIRSQLEECDEADLKEVCKTNGLSDKGKKTALIDRICGAIEKGELDAAELFGDDAEEGEEGEDGEEVSMEDLIEFLSDDDYDLAVVKAAAKACGAKVGLKDKTKEAILAKIEAEGDAELLYNHLVEAELLEG